MFAGMRLPRVLAWALTLWAAAVVRAQGIDLPEGSKEPSSWGLGLVGGAEMTVLQPFATDVKMMGLVLPTQSVDLSLRFPINDFNVSPRAWVGYVNREGTGIRGTYWRFDQDLHAEQSDCSLDGHHQFPPGSRMVGSGRLDMYALDIDLTQQIRFGKFFTTMGAGMRVAAIAHDRDNTLLLPGDPDFGFVFHNRFDGIGPTLSAEFRRPLSFWDMTFVSYYRGAMLMGEHHTRLATSRDFTFYSLNHTLPQTDMYGVYQGAMFAGEMRLGLEWSRDLGGVGKLDLRVLWETQFWAGSGMPMTSQGLTGGSFGIGISR